MKPKTNFIKKLIIFPLIFCVKLYQIIISPILPSSCRFQPTCSHYTIEALKEWGLFKGLYLSVKRISKCHPWGGFGEDKVPKKNK